MGSTAARGVAHLDLEQFSEARDYLQQALATARQTPDPLAEGMTLIWLGAVLENLGTPETAIKLPETAAALLGETGNRWQHAFAVQRIAEACHRLGRIGEALGHYRKAQAMFREFGDRLTEATVLAELGQAQMDLAKQSARQCWQTALNAFESLGSARAEQVRNQLRQLSVHENPQD